MSIEELNRLKIQIRDLESFVNYLRAKKLSRGLTDYEYKMYDTKKRELDVLNSRLTNTQNSKMLTLGA